MPSFTSSLPLYVGLCSVTTLTLLGTYFYKLTAPSRGYFFGFRAALGHYHSLAFTLLNPRGYPTEQDSFSLWTPEDELRGVSEREILARFTRGFFGGWVFMPERWFFAATGLSLVDGDALNAVSAINLTNKPYHREGCARPVNPVQIWSPAALSRTEPPPLGALLFGNFIVFDSNGADRKELFPAAAEKQHVEAPEGAACVEVVGGPSRRFGLLPSPSVRGEQEERGRVGGFVACAV